MELCVENVEKRSAMEEELEGARDILKKTLCGDCKTNLKSHNCSKSGSSKKIAKRSGISLKGKGNVFIMSILAVSMALVAIAGTGTKVDKGESLITTIPSEDTSIPATESNHRRNLVNIEDYETAV